MWHRTKVYFGLADDDSFYEDDDEDGSVAHDELEERYRRRPNVSKLDARRGSPRIDDIFADDDAPLRRRIRENAGGATTVLRPAEAGAISDDIPKVYLSIPRAFNDAQPIVTRKVTYVTEYVRVPQKHRVRTIRTKDRYLGGS